MNTKKQQGVTRRGFIRTVGLGGVAATALGIPGGVGAQAPAAGQAASMPRRKLGKTGVEVSILSLGGMFDTVNNQLLLRQALNWGVTYWDTAEAYGNGLSEEGFGRFFSRYPGSPQGNLPGDQVPPVRARQADRGPRQVLETAAHGLRGPVFHPRHQRHQRDRRVRQGLGGADEEGRQDQVFRLQHPHQHGGLPAGRGQSPAGSTRSCSPTTSGSCTPRK